METKYKIHAFYVLLIMASIIIILVSVRWGDIPSLVQYFSFALTLSSLMLAIIAIIYSFYSNSTNSQNIAVLSNISSKIAQSAELINNSTNEMNAQLQILPTHLKNVEGKVVETQSLMKEYYSIQSAGMASLKDIDSNVTSTKLVDLFLSRSSVNGLRLIYALTLGLSGKKEYEFDIEDFCKNNSFTDRSYAFGFLVATISTGLVAGQGTPNYKVEVRNINSQLSDKVLPRLRTLASENSPEQRGTDMSIIATIEKYFTH